MTTQTMVKLNNTNSISIVENNGTYEIAHMMNGEIAYNIMNDVLSNVNEFDLIDRVQDLASEFLNKELNANGYNAQPEMDAQVIVETFSYNVWISASLRDDKLVWELCTVRPECEDEDKDKNMVARSTWKGMMNYMKRFDV